MNSMGGSYIDDSSDSSFDESPPRNRAKSRSETIHADAEPIKNQHFDEALDVSQSTDLSETEPTEKEGRLLSNGRYDEEVDVGSDDSVATPELEDSPLRAQDSPSQTEIVVPGIDHRAGELAADGRIRNDRFDEAFEAECDQDASSVDTQPSVGGIHVHHEAMQSHTLGRNAPAFSTEKIMERRSIDSDASSRSREISPDSSFDEGRPMERVERFNLSDYTDLQVSEEIKDLFRYVECYKPQEVELETTLKCFIPPYIPAIGEVDPFLKVPRPDGKHDGLGLTVLDEPASLQSDAAVLDLKLRSILKKRIGTSVVRNIEHAAKNPHEIGRWINTLDELRRSKPPPLVHYKKDMPNIEQLMGVWPEEFETGLKDGVVKLPDASLDLSIEQMSKMMCSILDIPVYEGHLIESVHLMLTLFMEFNSL